MGLLSQLGSLFSAKPRQLPSPEAPAAARDAPPSRGSDGIQNLVAGLNTDRDKSFYSQYLPLGMGLDLITLGAMFRGSWIPRRIVTTVADDMCREWVKLDWDNYDTDVNTAKTIASAEAAFGLRSKVNEAVTWGRLYGGCVILIGIRGDDLSTPLVIENVKQGQLQFLHVIDRNYISASGPLDEDMDSPNFGLPVSYIIGSLMGSSGLSIHWTRVVRFSGQRLPKVEWMARGFWDDSVLQAPQMAVQAYDQATGGVASLMWEASVDIVTSPGLSDMLATLGGAAKVTARWQAAAQMKSMNRMLLLDGGPANEPNVRGDTYQQKTITFAGISDVLRDFRIDLCGAADIPATRLFGQSPAGMTATGESDIRNYYDHVSSRQETSLRPQLDTLYGVLVRSTLGKMPDNFSFEFNPLWQQTELEEWQVNRLKSETDHQYLDDGVLTEGAIAAELYDRKTYRTMDEDDIATAEELSEELAAETPALVGGRGLARGGPQAAPAPGESEGAPPPGGTVEPEAPATTPIGKPKIGDADVGDMIKREADGWHVYSGDGTKHLGGPYGSIRSARKRLRQVEHFRRSER